MAVWNVAASPSLSDEQKKAIIKYYQSETIRVTNQETRSQPENKLRVINKLNGMVERALIVEKERVPTKASLASRLKRIFLKKQRSEAKRNRQKPNQEE